MAFFLAFVIPALIALVIEMYVLLPVKLVHDPKLVVKINRSGRSRLHPMTATKEAIGPAVEAHRVLFISIYRGVFTGVGVVRGILELHGAYLKWSQTAWDKEFLVEMRLKNLEREVTKEEPVEKKGEQEQEEAGIRDLPVLDPVENQSDGESDNKEELFLL
ncbi:hypothetical protein BDM02DRAFT_3193119 [Thelephora ganbajun]|uniref:Uncharacterized protein n=1 Tax=Thelephora ganbajun TaxID=370292 RepID=A0ACB6YYZ0_THEGA|nr:hypothetical protein BDM02DRAFT_3193119 [Thelephora ganbajun]